MSLPVEQNLRNISNLPERGKLSVALLAPLSWVFILIIWSYRVVLGPMSVGRCRFQPSCSHYAEEAIHKHGPLRGGYLSLRRLLRCHPWGSFGSDPVP